MSRKRKKTANPHSTVYMDYLRQKVKMQLAELLSGNSELAEEMVSPGLRLPKSLSWLRTEVIAATMANDPTKPSLCHIARACNMHHTTLRHNLTAMRARLARKGGAA